MSAGPGVVQGLNLAGESIVGHHIEGLSGPENERSPYTSAAQIDVRRGHLVTWTATIYKWSHFAALETAMTARTEETVVVQYLDAKTDTLANAIVTVRPVLTPVPDQAKILIGTIGTAPNAMTDLGKIIGTVQPETTMAADTDGQGRPHPTWYKVALELMLPGDAYAALASFVGDLADLAIEKPDGNYDLFNSVYIDRQYGPGDSSQPRTVQLNANGVGANWNGLIQYVEADGTAATRPDLHNSFELVCTAQGYTEPVTRT